MAALVQNFIPHPPKVEGIPAEKRQRTTQDMQKKNNL